MTYTYSMNAERVLMAFLVALAFALVLVIPIRAKAALITGTATPMSTQVMKNTPVATTTAKAQVQTLPVKKITNDDEIRAQQLSQIAEMIRQIQILLARLNK